MRRWPACRTLFSVVVNGSPTWALRETAAPRYCCQRRLEKPGVYELPDNLKKMIYDVSGGMIKGKS